MPAVEFHILSEAGDDVRVRHACTLVQAAYDNAQRVFIHVDSESEARRIDDALWIFRDQAFIPHEIAATSSPSHPRIMALIGMTPAPADFTTLINLGNAVPPEFVSSLQIFEIVDGDVQRKQAGRERYKQYREQGCTLQTKNF